MNKWNTKTSVFDKFDNILMSLFDSTDATCYQQIVMYI